MANLVTECRIADYRGPAVVTDEYQMEEDLQVLQITTNYFLKNSEVPLHDFWLTMAVSLRQLDEPEGRINRIRDRFFENVRVSERDEKVSAKDGGPSSVKNHFRGIDSFNELKLSRAQVKDFGRKVIREAAQRSKSLNDSKVLTFSHDLKRVIKGSDKDALLIGNVNFNGDVFFVMMMPHPHKAVSNSGLEDSNPRVFGNLKDLVDANPRMGKHAAAIQRLQREVGSAGAISKQQQFFSKELEQTLINVRRYFETEFRFSGKLSYEQIAFDRVFAHYLYKFSESLVNEMRSKYEVAIGVLARDVMSSTRSCVPEGIVCDFQGFFDILPPPSNEFVEAQPFYTGQDIAKGLVQELVSSNSSNPKGDITPANILHEAEESLRALHADPDVIAEVTQTFSRLCSHLPPFDRCVSAEVSRSACEAIVKKVHDAAPYVAGLFLCRLAFLEKKTFDQIMDEGVQSIATRGGVTIDNERGNGALTRGFDDALTKYFPGNEAEIAKRRIKMLKGESTQLKYQLGVAQDVFRQMQSPSEGGAYVEAAGSSAHQRSSQYGYNQFAALMKTMAYADKEEGYSFVGMEHFKDAGHISVVEFADALAYSVKRLYERRNIAFAHGVMKRSLTYFLKFLGVDERAAAECLFSYEVQEPAIERGDVKQSCIESSKQNCLQLLLEQSAVSLPLVAYRMIRRLRHEGNSDAVLRAMSFQNIINQFEIPEYSMDQTRILGQKIQRMLSGRNRIMALLTPEQFAIALVQKLMERRSNGLENASYVLRSQVIQYLKNMHVSERYMKGVMTGFDGQCRANKLTQEKQVPVKPFQSVYHKVLTDVFPKVPYLTGAQMIHNSLEEGTNLKTIKTVGFEELARQYNLSSVDPRIIEVMRQGFTEALERRCLLRRQTQLGGNQLGRAVSQPLAVAPRTYSEKEVFGDSSRRGRMLKRLQNKQNGSERDGKRVTQTAPPSSPQSPMHRKCKSDAEILAFLGETNSSASSFGKKSGSGKKTGSAKKPGLGKKSRSGKKKHESKPAKSASSAASSLAPAEIERRKKEKEANRRKTQKAQAASAQRKKAEKKERKKANREQRAAEAAERKEQLKKKAAIEAGEKFMAQGRAVAGARAERLANAKRERAEHLAKEAEERNR